MELASFIISVLSLIVGIVGLVLAIRKQVADWQRARGCSEHPRKI